MLQIAAPAPCLTLVAGMGRAGQGWIMKIARACAFLLASMAMAPGTVHAIGACVCNDRSWSMPWFARAMPLNPRIFVSVRDPGPFTARLTTGAVEVPVDVTAAGGGWQNLWIAPRSPLSPSSSYTLVVSPSRPDGRPDLAAGLTFDTVSDASGRGIDTQPPVVTGVMTQSGGLADNCNVITGGATLHIESLVDEFALGDALIQLDVTVGDHSERLFLPYQGSSEGWQAGVAIGADVSATGADCIGDRRLAGGVVGGSYPARLTAWDWSGNATIVEGLTLTLAANPAPSSGGPGHPAPATADASGVVMDGGAARGGNRAAGCQVGRNGGNDRTGMLGGSVLASWLLARRGRRG
jgi:hypothetical protein